MTEVASGSIRVAALTADPELRDAVVRLGALAGVAVEVVGASSGVRPAWRAADVVVVGADLAPALVALNLARRSRVALISAGPADSELWRVAVQLGAAGLFVLPADERSLVDLMASAHEPPNVAGQVIGVMGGCGGAGASTVAAALALAGAADSSTVLIDGDPLGGGLDVLLGAEREPGLRWPDLVGTRGRLDAASVADRLIGVGGARLLSWARTETPPLPPDAAGSVVAAVTRAFDLVILDLPRHPSVAAQVLADAADRLLVVTPATVRAVAATAALVADRGSTDGLELIVRDGGGRYPAIADVATALGLPVATSIHSESAVTTAAQRGEPPPARGRGSLARACRDILSRRPVVSAA